MAHFESLTVFFPMWNEQDYIHPAINAAKEICLDLMSGHVIADYEILIINDASTDRTGFIADALAQKDPHIRVVHHATNRKLGGSIKSGLAHARGELILYSDADLPFDFFELHKAARLLRIYGADIVSCYRHDRTGEGPVRAIYSFVYNWLIRFMFGIFVRDINFAFKLMRRRILEHIKPVSEGSFIDAELLIRAHRSGFNMIQFGVDYFPRSRGISTLSSPATIMIILQELWQLRKLLKQIKPLAKEQLKNIIAAPIEKLRKIG